jgi:predicted MFS family arabinose efflux permease
MRQAFRHIIKIKNIWLLGIIILGFSGCVSGLTGYLPLYLRGQGWAEVSADGALSLINGLSLIFVLPIAFWSDRTRARKSMLLNSVLILTVGTGLLSITSGMFVWGSALLIGLVKDWTYTLLIIMVIENDGVGPRYSGTASGLVIVFMYIGNLLSAPIGNKFADISPGFPFIFWAGLALLAAVVLLFVRPSQVISGQPEYIGRV